MSQISNSNRFICNRKLFNSSLKGSCRPVVLKVPNLGIDHLAISYLYEEILYDIHSFVCQKIRHINSYVYVTASAKTFPNGI